MTSAPSQTRGDRARFERHSVRGHRGISFRKNTDGSRSYSVYAQRKYVPAGTTLAEAKAVQADLRGRAARGERVVVAPKITFAEALLDIANPIIRHELTDQVAEIVREAHADR